MLSKVDPSVQTVLCGDFNSVVDRAMDRRGSSPLDYSRESSVMLTALFRDCCVLDAWRLCHPTDKSFIWTKADGSISSRIDLIGRLLFRPVSFIHVPSQTIPWFL